MVEIDVFGWERYRGMYCGVYWVFFVVGDKLFDMGVIRFDCEVDGEGFFKYRNLFY